MVTERTALVSLFFAAGHVSGTSRDINNKSARISTEALRQLEEAIVQARPLITEMLKVDDDTEVAR